MSVLEGGDSHGRFVVRGLTCSDCELCKSALVLYLSVTKTVCVTKWIINPITNQNGVSVAKHAALITSVKLQDVNLRLFVSPVAAVHAVHNGQARL